MVKYSLLKGTVNHLQIKDDPKGLRSDDIGLLAMIGLMIVVAFELIGVLIGSLTSGSITLEGKSFQCYVGRKKVQGKLEHTYFGVTFLKMYSFIVTKEANIAVLISSNYYYNMG